MKIQDEKNKHRRMLASAAEACDLLKIVASPHRLAMLCFMVEKEQSVGDLAAALDLRDATASQNLGVMRRAGVVAARRDGQTMWYSIRDPKVKPLLETLYSIYCADSCPPRRKAAKKTS